MTHHRILQALDKIVGGLAFAGAAIGVVILMSITVLILIEITIRSLWGMSTQIVEEYVGYGLGAMIFLALGQALRAGALVRVDLIAGRLRPTARRWLEIVLALVAAGVVGFLSHYVLISVARNYTRGTTSVTMAKTAMWIPEGLVLVGMVL
ncbi:MAG: TRAP transporter small permease, partial [Gemmobacter sp.]|nr:TRAP transporter small permease [Gemmobacter sp.]